MRINELLIENNQIDEISLGGVGRGIGNIARGAATAIGGVAGGVVGAGQALAKGYKDGKSYVGGKPSAPTGSGATPGDDVSTGISGGTAPAGVTTVSGGEQDPAALRQQAASLTKQADELEKAQTTAQAPEPAGTPAAPSPEEIRKTKQADAAKVAQDQMAAPKAPAPTPAGTSLPPGVNPEKANAAQQAAGLPPLYKQTADGGWEETDQAKGTFVGNKTQAAPAPTTTPPPAVTPPADGKMTQAQQDALKAKLQGQRQAGKTTATQTSSGFKNYVGGSGERMTGVDASGAPVYQKIQRESVGYSNFLGRDI